MFLVQGRTDKSTVGISTRTAGEALLKRQELALRQMAVVVMNVDGKVIPLAELQKLAGEETMTGSSGEAG